MPVSLDLQAGYCPRSGAPGDLTAITLSERKHKWRQALH